MDGLVTINRDLRTIMDITRKIIKEEYMDSIFCGPISALDFAKFVYFEYCAGEFLKAEPEKAINKNVLEFKERYSKELIDCEESSDNFSYFWLQQQNEVSMNRKLYRYLDSMLKGRSIPCSSNDKDGCWGALRAIDEFQCDSHEAQKKGIPLKRGYFYQLLTQACVQNRGRELYSFLSKKRTSAQAIESYYNAYDRFIHNFMMKDYIYEDFSAKYSDAQDAYIAQAINLFTLEDRYKLNCMYEFAVKLSENESIDSVITEWDKKFMYASCPPMLADCVQAYRWNYTYKATGRLDDIGRVFNRIKYLWGYMSDLEGIPMCPAPVPNYSKYVDFFMKSDEYECSIEEFCYYTLQLTAQLILLLIHRDNTDIFYSNAKFTLFLKQFYNVEEVYENHMEYRKAHPITKKIANRLHQIAAIIDPLHDSPG